MVDINTKRELWLRDANSEKNILDGRVKNDIERYRKGYCKIKFTDENGNPITGKEVSVHQTKHAFKYGANMFMLDEFPDEERNARYRENFKKYFNLGTVPFYWCDLEPEKGKPRFDKNSQKIYRRPPTELCVEYCEESDIDAKLHCLVYDKFIPSWLPLKDMKKMEEEYEEHFRGISERYAGRLFEVEVINELLCENSWEFKSVISEKRDILEWSFGLARKYFPSDKLVLNEAGQLMGLSHDDYRNSYFMMIDAALKAGVCIDKIGVQHHNFLGARTTTEQEYDDMILNRHAADMFKPSVILKGLDILSEFGLPLELTEITVPTFGTTEEDEELQAELLDVVYTTAFGHPSVDTLVYWNAPEGFAYDPQNPKAVWNENRCRGGLFHGDMTPKKSAERLYEMFNKRWRTNETLVTDENGYVEFRGFYGSYTASICGQTAEFDIIKNETNSIIIDL